MVNTKEDDNMHPSAALYTRFVLRGYDFVVLQFSNAFAWCCPTDSALLPLFRQHIGAQAHLDVGPGSGYYLAASAAELAEVERLTLVDLNPDALQYTKERLQAVGHTRTMETMIHDVFKPFPSAMHGQYDSISMFYVFHCLPGAFPHKARDVITRLKPLLKPSAVFYGATILGQAHNWLGNCLMDLYNGKGVFCNKEDTREGLEEALAEHYEEVEVRIVGRVALFVARKPTIKCNVS
ncbi:S-adenosyl-L-methionine dependent methyltransferase [Cristinia sonorae]|uniref:S-adenosyl-L-methionine dependent methyltransferase n=1 Tax=Cristinia sonorae TaxID=1940300 RepID=A0A8K0XMT7_9AGAR|nr:S-adenosyl-L-methionine dependent methyltransferase [Cristinia sonorae]